MVKRGSDASIGQQLQFRGIMHKFWKSVEKNFNVQDLNNFKNWEDVRKIPLYIERDWVDGYYPDVKAMIETNPNKDWEKVYLEPALGHTPESLLQAEFIFEGKIRSTGFRLKSMHHGLTYETLAGKSLLNYDMIIEFGAGIGELAKTIFELGYGGRYVVVDLPVISQISSFYNNGMTESVSSIDQILGIPKNTLFIATWSLSETPFGVRKVVAETIKGMDQLILFQKSFFEIENFEYFTEEWPLLTNTFFRLKKIWFHEHQNGNYYLVCKS
jgi:hypothetical protein